MKKLTGILLSMATVWVAMSFSTPIAKSTGIKVVFDHFVGCIPLHLDTTHYVNSLRQDFVITKLKYYIGGITFKRLDGSLFVDSNYYLISEDEPESKVIGINSLPEGIYKGVSFILGVDSLHNCSGAQSGALDPANAMFWAWNTGYIFLKLEGRSPASGSPGHIFEYHIGGYKAPVNAIRQINLQFQEPIIANGVHELHIKADVAQIVGGNTPLDFSRLSSVTDSRNAVLVADNYKNMFSVIYSK